MVASVATAITTPPPRVLIAKPKAIVASPTLAAEPEPSPAPAAEAPAPVPTSQPVVVATTAAATTPPAVAKPIDAANAKVTVGNVATTNGLPASSVRSALSHVPLTRCYREALAGRTTPARGTSTLRLAIDDTGHVIAATLDGAAFLPTVRACIENASKTMLVKNVDTGDASASVTLEFAHP
jgi:hypothetical protein